MDEQVEVFLQHLAEKRGLSVNTTAAYRTDLEQFCVFLRDRGLETWQSVAHEDMLAFLLFLRERLRTETHPKIRKQLEKRLRDVAITRDLGILQGAIDRFVAERGKPPGDVAALVAGGYLKKALVDPTGRPYTISDGKAVSQTEFEVMRLKE